MDVEQNGELMVHRTTDVRSFPARPQCSGRREGQVWSSKVLTTTTTERLQ